ncbi:hypothetical protein AMS68_002704 [Peltaster fructicola]|uniref:Uncharacterized protein n=1 Tax=Peltaster fructicola TaxID=286661 RepID=A0A6H0XR01_9PEZI|nr:hypothetical protein AMS68_002704 [Peltaster fructicola]
MHARRRLLSAECDKKDTSTWTSEWLTNIFLIDNEYSPVLIKNLFGWTKTEWLTNAEIVIEELARQGIKDLGLRARIPDHGDQRIAVETALKARADHRFELPHVRNGTVAPGYILPEHIVSGLVKYGTMKPASAYQYLILACCRWGRARARVQAALKTITGNRQQHGAVEEPGVEENDNQDGSDDLDERDLLTDNERAATRHHSTKQISSRIDKDHITLCVGNVGLVAGTLLTIHIKRYQLKDCFEAPDWQALKAAITLGCYNMHIFCFNNGKVWSIDNGLEFRGQTNDLWLKMDTELCNTAISVFVAEKKQYVQMIPEQYQHIEVLSDEEIILDLEEV